MRSRWSFAQKLCGLFEAPQTTACPTRSARSRASDLSDYVVNTANDGRLSDTAQLLHTEIEFRPRADVYPNILEAVVFGAGRDY